MPDDATALQLEKAITALAELQARPGIPRRSPLSSLAKRGIDVALAVVVGVLCTPVMILVALAVKLSSPGPVLFRQVRLGKDGAPFVFYKFRTMRHGNDDATHRDFSRSFIRGDHQKQKPVFKMVGDPRITPVGHFLRKYSLDELPQLWNVLGGEMSLVGPRPAISYEIEHYRDWHLDRLKVKPGMTGLWQVSGRSHVPFHEMVLLDLHYITNWSLALDLKILARTVPVMVRGDGGY